MIEWLKKWFLMWGKRRVASSLPAVPLVAEWTNDDRAFLLRFLQSPTGAKLFQRWCAVGFKASREASKDPVSPVHSVGRAAGFMDALEWMISLSVVTPDDVTNDSPASGETQQAEKDLAIN